MDDKDSQQIEDLFHSALEMNAEDRAAYLAEATSGDQALQSEVKSLIAAFEDGLSLIDQPALTLGMKVLVDDSSVSLVGQSIGQYRILRLLGKGGMGEVYLAEDSKLERPVALKFFKGRFIDDVWARQQLTSEARAVAKLDHSNICAVYGIEEMNGYNFIVMQFVEGKTLSSWLRDGPPEIWKVLDLAEQIVSALVAAQTRGIIHKDIKPQNIVVTAEGQVKVLDFGLARFIPQKLEGAASEPRQPRQEEPVVGTIAYMSPEQLRAEELDCRSDIFSFGTVLHEMLAGSNPFKRDHVEDLISAIKGDPAPPVTKSNPLVPGALERIVGKCLAKKREQRYETANELLLDLQNSREDYLLSVAHPAKRWILQQRKYLKTYAVALLVFAVLCVAGGTLTYSRLTRTHTLAVLPFQVGNGDPDAQYLSEGLSRSIIDKLSGLARLRVKPSTAVSIYNKPQLDPASVGRELGVEAVLVGTLVQHDESLHVHARLLQSDDGALLWEKNFNIKVSQIPQIQDQITEDLIASLHVWTNRDERKLLTRHQTDNPEALRLYMRGQFYWNRRSEENLKTAISLFTQATEVDPTYAQAFAGLADSYMFLPTPAYGAKKTEEMIEKARYCAQQALKLDNMLCEAHTSLGVIKLRYDWDWQEAEKKFRQAIQLNPDYAPAHYWYSNLLMILRRSEESIRESETNRRLDPFSSSSTMNLGRAYYFARQYDKASGYYRELLAQKPDDHNARYMLALAYLQRRMYPESIAELQKLYSTKPLYAAAPLGYAYAKSGARAEALGILSRLDEISETQHVPAQERAIIHIGLNEKDQAFKYLEEAYKERYPALIGVTSDPLFDDLRSDPRFAELARRLNLPF